MSHTSAGNPCGHRWKTWGRFRYGCGWNFESKILPMEYPCYQRGNPL